MKKLLEIIKIPALNDSFQLQLDFKTQRHNLKRYLKSLKELKTKAKAAHHYFANSAKNTADLVESYSSIKKKNSELDYFMANGFKLFQAINTQTKKMDTFYEDIYTQAKDVIERLVKYLEQSKESYTRASSQHQKSVKDYAEKCFPETTTILYILGFVNKQKVQKCEDLMKQQFVLKETQMYTAILNTYLDQMENLKNETTNLFKLFYTGASQLYLTCSGQIQQEVVKFEINEEQLEACYKETGGATTDRSDRSAKDHQEEDI